MDIVNKRDDYYDFWRGIAIMMVVGIHTFAIPSFDTTGGIYSTFVRQILNCAVPIFLAISGLFLGKKELNTKPQILHFWKKQIPKVYIPMLLWSVLYFINAIRNDWDWYFVAKQLFMLFVGGYSIYYFIILILQYYLLLPFLKKYKSLMLILSIIISIISILLITYNHTIKGINLPLVVYAGPFVTWFMFFMIGVYCSTTTINCSLKNIVLMIVVGFLLECVETYFLNTNYGGGFGIKLSSYIYSVAVILFMFSPTIKSLYKNNFIISTITNIGSASFGIYLIHCFVILIIKSTISINNWFFEWFFTLLITYLIIFAFQRIFSSRVVKYLGL